MTPHDKKLVKRMTDDELEKLLTAIAVELEARHVPFPAPLAPAPYFHLVGK